MNNITNIVKSRAEYFISGIQQVGIGVTNVREAWKWYKKHFGTDIRIFEDEAVAGLMLPYTDGKPRKRLAALAINMQGGGGFEIWQYKDRIPLPPAAEVQLGDYGINAVKIKSHDVARTYQSFVSSGLSVSAPEEGPGKTENFFLTDPYNNMFQIVGGNSWFKNENKLTGAAYGVIVGVSDMDKSVAFYRDILGYDETVYDTSGVFSDLAQMPGGKGNFRRALLKHKDKRQGAFSPVLGDSQIELLQSLDRKPSSIFKGRLWGDLGFIHLCFDIHGMNALREECLLLGHPFTVDSSTSFDMGEAAGHFSYIEDPDGTLIEFVETHRVPILKKLGWYLNLQKRDPHKSLPRWILKSLAFNRVKDF
ncbi:MAG TPA: VOC family protein [Bacteroidales bacterium]|nr:VOC family protein [Bacteroidales bacterium]HPT01890.1 VOC family protein [Bacteroidales bacterium]